MTLSLEKVLGYKMMKQGFIRSLCVCLMMLGATFMAQAEDEGTVAVQSHYYPLDPAFVTNFGTSKAKLKFLKAEISLKVLGPTSLSAVSKHNPMIRHHIVMVLSRQAEDTMYSSAGQETIRKQALESVQAAMEEETGEAHIEDLLFTTFVVQR